MESQLESDILEGGRLFTYESHGGFPVGVLHVEDKMWRGPTVSHSPACIKAEPAFVYGSELRLLVAQTIRLKLSGVSEKGNPLEVLLTFPGDLMQKNVGLPTALAVSPPALKGWIRSQFGANEWSVKRPFSTRHLDRAEGLELGTGAGKIVVVRDLPRETQFMEKFLSPELIHCMSQPEQGLHAMMRECP